MSTRLPEDEYADLVRRSHEEHRTVSGHLRWLVSQDAAAHPATEKAVA